MILGSSLTQDFAARNNLGGSLPGSHASESVSLCPARTARGSVSLRRSGESLSPNCGIMIVSGGKGLGHCPCSGYKRNMGSNYGHFQLLQRGMVSDPSQDSHGQLPPNRGRG